MMEVTTLFQPKGDYEHLTREFDRVPAYLFRTYAPSSYGVNADNVFASAASTCALDESDILGRDPEESKAMLRGHLTWRAGFRDNLVSWTCSFIFAVQHGIRRLATDRKTPDAADIRICILNTKTLPRGTFLSAVALMEAYEVTDQDKLHPQWSQGEYLSQGSFILEAPESSPHIATTSLQALMQNGLFQLYPPFGNVMYQSFLATRVAELRMAFRERASPPTAEQLRLATSITDSCFVSPRLRVVVAATLLSLEPRPRLDPKTFEKFRHFRCATIIPRATLDSFAITSSAVPEHNQFVELMHDLYADGQRHEWVLREQERKVGREGLDKAMEGLSMKSDE